MKTSAVSGAGPSPDPTPAELEAGACLPQEPEPLQSRATVAPPPPVQVLVQKHPSAATAALPPKANAAASENVSPPHRGFALGIGANAAVGPIAGVGVEASIGVVVDLTTPKLSLFTNTGGGIAIVSGVSAGVSAQISAVRDVSKFWGSGAEDGVNLPVGGGAINYSTPAPGGERTVNGLTDSVGPSFGGDAHSFEGTTTELGSVSLEDIKETLKRAVGLAGVRRMGQ